MPTNYIPSNVLEFQNLVHNVRTSATANQTAWDISKEALGVLDLPVTNFDAAVAIAENPATRTKAAIKKRDEMRAALEAVFRPFVQGHLMNSLLVSDNDRLAMGLPVRDHHPTPLPDPEESPEISLSTPEAATVEVTIRRKGVRGRAKPKGVHGTEIGMVVSDSSTPPLRWQGLNRSEFSTRSTVRFTFDGEDRGKWLHLSGRFENMRGVKGPWCEIISIIIP
jgi:uncharacterized small protein (DUF1192 family)